MASIGQYLRDTRVELTRVAWPSQRQTVIFTLLVAAISIGSAAYLGLFDYVFTSTLTHVVDSLPAQNPISVSEIATSSVPASTTTGAVPATTSAR